MKRKLHISASLYKLFFALFALVITTTVSAQTEWKLSTDKEGIKIYTSLVPGSKVKAIKVECTMDATASQLVAMVMDVKNSPDWVYRTKSAVLIKQVSPSELYYYSEVNLPWPAANRDFVAHLIVNQDPDTKIVTIEAPVVTGLVPVKKGIVRIDHSNGKWTITPTGNDHVKVEYSIHVDPGGDLPSWLVNMFATEGPMQIFRNLKLELQKPSYKNIYVAFVEN
ncbi:MAG: START domain-containing protein [Mucilaginibacter sp.]